MISEVTMMLYVNVVNYCVLVNLLMYYFSTFMSIPCNNSYVVYGLLYNNSSTPYHTGSLVTYDTHDTQMTKLLLRIT